MKQVEKYKIIIQQIDALQNELCGKLYCCDCDYCPIEHFSKDTNKGQKHTNRCGLECLKADLKQKILDEEKEV